MSDVSNAGLIAPVKDGKLNYTASAETSTESTKGSSALGKDAFLQLLVTQMQYQDPLNPSDNTEYVSQLATFSQLEALQNLNTESEKSQAFALVGKNVTIKETDSNGRVTYPSGVVDFISISASGVKLSVGGINYDYDQLISVEDTAYHTEQSLPEVEKAYEYEYNAKLPKDFTFEVDFGSDDQKATEVAMIINGANIDPSYMSYDDNKVTVSKDAFAGLPNGEYKASLIFNNGLLTQVHDKITVKIFNSQVEQEAEDGTQNTETEGTQGSTTQDDTQTAESTNPES